MNNPTFIRLRFAFKLSFAIVFALFVGFHLNLETPRWSAMTAAIVAAGPAFAAAASRFPARSATAAGCVLSAPLSAALSAC
ncbi:p-hydroxybenzoic acid efflux pump subunit AaeB [Serratia rubidaea]|uniref:p-hydroxybenzoic acid efflux pump subunit AaeB n=1 Tax=Serratia rubidaea TaxID=61652 RepID=A0A4U9HTJ4_SERRU|nr:p-hydroxybenzoic acid efflux pump subunit AaeB [Serratia rubidaea]